MLNIETLKKSYDRGYRKGGIIPPKVVIVASASKPRYKVLFNHLMISDDKANRRDTIKHIGEVLTVGSVDFRDNSMSLYNNGVYVAWVPVSLLRKAYKRELV